MSRTWPAPATKKVAPVTLDGEGFDEINEEQLVAIREKFIEKLAKRKLMSSVVDSAGTAPDVIVLKSTITSYDKGSGAARFFFGLGAGAATLTMHVALLDKETEQLIAETDITDKDRASLSANVVKMGERAAKSVGDFIKKRGQGGKKRTFESEF